MKTLPEEATVLCNELNEQLEIVMEHPLYSKAQTKMDALNICNEFIGCLIHDENSPDFLNQLKTTVDNAKQMVQGLEEEWARLTNEHG